MKRHARESGLLNACVQKSYVAMKSQAQTRLGLCSDSDLDSAQTQTCPDPDSSRTHSLRLFSDSVFFWSQNLSRLRLYSDSDSAQIQILFRLGRFPATNFVE